MSLPANYHSTCEISYAYKLFIISTVVPYSNFLMKLFREDEDLKLLFEMLRNSRLFRDGKSEGKLPFKELFERFKKESEVR